MSVARVTWKKKTSGSFYYAAKKKVLLQIHAIVKVVLHILTKNVNGV